MVAQLSEADRLSKNPVLTDHTFTDAQSRRILLINPQKQWPQMRRYANHPLARLALDAGMELWCRDCLDQTWDHKRGPWAYSRTDYWCERKRPRKDSPDWYKCILACHWMRSFTCAIGQLAYPRYTWRIIEGEKHSTTIGYRGKTIWILDLILCDELSGKEILECAGWPDDCQSLSLERDLLDKLIELREPKMILKPIR